jgi:hypothetical protein
MHDSVTFDLCQGDRVAMPNLKGYANASLPVDAAARLVLASTESPIEAITVAYGDGPALTYRVRDIMHENVNYTPSEYVAEFSIIGAFADQVAAE